MRFEMGLCVWCDFGQPVYVPALLENLYGMSCSGACWLWVVLDYWLVKVSWLGKLVSVLWCVEMDFFSLECNGVPSDEFCTGSMC